jgi:hypothetical protein
VRNQRQAKGLKWKSSLPGSLKSAAAGKKTKVRNYRPVGSLHRKILQNGRENGQKNTSVKIETRKLPPG